VLAAKGPHAINSKINSVLAEVLETHDAYAAMKPWEREKQAHLLRNARQRVSGLTADIQALRKQGGPVDAIQCAEIAQREMLANLTKLQTSLKLWPE
jgi:hypothetical protein